jgi:hypothetical protein
MSDVKRDIVDRLMDEHVAASRTEAAEEITALRARVAEVEKERDGWLSASVDLQNRAQRAEAALATARRDALEEAAKVCDERGAAEQVNYGLNRGTQNYFRARDAIRALIAQEEPTT